MYYLGLLIEYLKNYMKTRLTYRADFWVEVISDLLFQATNFIFILVIFMHTDSLGGWNQNEVVFVYGFFMVPYGVFSCFVNMWGFSERYIVKGEMDRILTRPAHNLFQIFLENVDPPALFGSIIGLIIMAISGANLGLPFEWWTIPAMILLTLSAVAIYTGIYTTLTSLSFYSDAPARHSAADVQYSELWPLSGHNLQPGYSGTAHLGNSVRLRRYLSGGALSGTG